MLEEEGDSKFSNEEGDTKTPEKAQQADTQVVRLLLPTTISRRDKDVVGIR